MLSCSNARPTVCVVSPKRDSVSAVIATDGRSAVADAASTFAGSGALGIDIATQVCIEHMISLRNYNEVRDDAPERNKTDNTK